MLQIQSQGALRLMGNNGANQLILQSAAKTHSNCGEQIVFPITH